MLQQFLVTMATLAALALITIAVIMAMREHKAWKLARNGRTRFKAMSPHGREHEMMGMLHSQLGALWDMPREERPMIAIMLKTKKGEGVMMFGHPDGITEQDKDYSRGKCFEVLQAIAINMGRTELLQDKSNCVNTLMSLLDHEIIKIRDKKNEEEQIKNLLPS